jgi:predicted GTPase
MLNSEQQPDSAKAEIWAKINRLLLDANLQARGPSPRISGLPSEDSFFTTHKDMLYEIKKESQNTELSDKKLDQICHRAKSRGFSFLLVGRAGVGKSSTINSLMGREIAPVGKFEAETKIVSAYEAPSDATIPYRIYDTPGLCDADGDNKEYLQLIHDKIQEPIDCLWFVTILTEARVRTDEKDAIAHIVSAFGKEVWKRAVIIFTCADKVSSKEFELTLAVRTRLIRDQIAAKVGKEIADDIPSVAVSNVSLNTPDKKSWLGRLFVRTFIRISKEGLDGFLLEIVNWRGLDIDNNASSGGRSSHRDSHIHHHVHYDKSTHTHGSVINSPITYTIEGEPPDIQKKFLTRVETVFGGACGWIASVAAYHIAKPMGGDKLAQAASGIAGEVGGAVGDAVSRVVDKAVAKGVEMLRNTKQAMQNIFGRR